MDLLGSILWAACWATCWTACWAASWAACWAACWAAWWATYHAASWLMWYMNTPMSLWLSKNILDFRTQFCSVEVIIFLWKIWKAKQLGMISSIAFVHFTHRIIISRIAFRKKLNSFFQKIMNLNLKICSNWISFQAPIRSGNSIGMVVNIWV